jgi:hypothetical protein
MQCPKCGYFSPDAWKVFHVSAPGGGLITQLVQKAPADSFARTIVLEWMECANSACAQVVIRATATYQIPRHAAPELQAEVWLVYPRRSYRPLDPLITGTLRQDYDEAAALLDLTPRLSAVLTRKIVFDLLEQYAGIGEYTLKASLDKFIGDKKHPARIKENLQHLREIGDFGAHTKKDGVGQVIDVSREDAEWTLDLVDRLFDYFILDAERDKKLRGTWDKNLDDAGRKPIPPVPPDTGATET